jgi:hypothetical protein
VLNHNSHSAYAEYRLTVYICVCTRARVCVLCGSHSRPRPPVAINATPHPASINAIVSPSPSPSRFQPMAHLEHPNPSLSRSGCDFNWRCTGCIRVRCDFNRWCTRRPRPHLRAHYALTPWQSRACDGSATNAGDGKSCATDRKLCVVVHAVFASDGEKHTTTMADRICLAVFHYETQDLQIEGRRLTCCNCKKKILVAM